MSDNAESQVYDNFDEAVRRFRDRLLLQPVVDGCDCGKGKPDSVLTGMLKGRVYPDRAAAFRAQEDRHQQEIRRIHISQIIDIIGQVADKRQEPENFTELIGD